MTSNNPEQNKPKQINTASDYLALSKEDKSKTVRKAVEAANAEQRAFMEPPEPWEEEFKMIYHSYSCRSQSSIGCLHPGSAYMQAFIRKVAQQARQEALEEAIEVLEKKDYGPCCDCLRDREHYIETLKNLLTPNPTK